MIEKTLAYQKMDGVQQSIVRRSASKKRILYNLQLLQNVGMERWKELNTGLPVKWREIVVELHAKKVKNCPHPKEAQFIKVIETIVNCETTVIICTLCKEHLTEPETDCR